MKKWDKLPHDAQESRYDVQCTLCRTHDPIGNCLLVFVCHIQKKNNLNGGASINIKKEVLNQNISAISGFPAACRKVIKMLSRLRYSLFPSMSNN